MPVPGDGGVIKRSGAQISISIEQINRRADRGNQNECFLIAVFYAFDAQKSR